MSTRKSPLGESGRDTGTRLREIRLSQGLTLRAAAARSGGVFRAVTLGSWERADRALTVDRLAEVAEFWDVTPESLLPGAQERLDAMAARYETGLDDLRDLLTRTRAELADVRSENAMLRAQAREVA